MNNYKNNTSRKILIIDDDDKLRDLMIRFLQTLHYQVIAAPEGKSGLEMVQKEEPDLVLLDVMMPGDDGFEVLRKIRESGETPVIMLTARGETTDRVIGLRGGADDYIPKPFEPSEIEARIEAVLRRSGRNHTSSETINFGDFEVDFQKREVITGDTPAELTSSEFMLLEYFLQNKGVALSRDQITESLRGEEFDLYNRSVDILISRLRKKLGDDPKKPQIIKTLHGHGYIFIAQEK